MITNRIGFSFAMPIVIVGAVLSLVGCVTLLENLILGIGLILVGSFLFTSSYGSQIDEKSKKYREYGSFFGIKSGKWKALEAMSFLTVHKSRTGMTIRSQSNRSTTSIDDDYGLYLLNETHRLKVLIQKFENQKEANNYAHHLTSLINKDIVHFKPASSRNSRIK